jgi:hypothetical protein
MLRTGIDSIGKRGLLPVGVFLVVVVLLWVRAREEMVEEDSPLFSATVKDATRELEESGRAKVDAGSMDGMAGQLSSRDTAIADFVRKDMVTRQATGTTTDVYIFWSEKSGRFEKAGAKDAVRTTAGVRPQQEANDQVFAYWCDKTKRFEVVPLGERGKVQKEINPGWGIALSKGDCNIYVYWCEKCKGVHEETWNLEKMSASESPPRAVEAHHGQNVSGIHSEVFRAKQPERTVALPPSTRDKTSQ